MAQTIGDWFAEQKERLTIEVQEVALADMHDWQVVEEAGRAHHIGHTSGRYHRGVFLKAWDTVRNEWIERFLIAPIPPDGARELYGVALLARYKDRYLVQAKAEPGNKTPGHVQVTSTIQASYTNITSQLSGKIPFTWMYEDPRCVQFEISQDGAQLYLKNNTVCFLELSEEPTEIPTNFAWATAADIRSLAKQGLVSEHVMQCLGASMLEGKQLS
jgi:hypothetical protein